MQVKVLPDSADEALVSDDSLAYIKITSVKPVSVIIHYSAVRVFFLIFQGDGGRSTKDGWVFKTCVVFLFCIKR